MMIMIVLLMMMMMMMMMMMIVMKIRLSGGVRSGLEPKRRRL